MDLINNIRLYIHLYKNEKLTNKSSSEAKKNPLTS